MKFPVKVVPPLLLIFLTDWSDVAEAKGSGRRRKHEKKALLSSKSKGKKKNLKKSASLLKSKKRGSKKKRSKGSKKKAKLPPEPLKPLSPPPKPIKPSDQLRPSDEHRPRPGRPLEPLPKPPPQPPIKPLPVHPSPLDPIDAVLLRDLFPEGSTQCKNADVGGSGRFHSTFRYFPSDTVKGDEQKFLAQLGHKDPDRNLNWIIRVGKGGDVYSMVGAYGEAAPPQTFPEVSPWTEAVFAQTSAADTNRNNRNEGLRHNIAQAGSLMTDDTYMPPPFYSPNVAKSCDDQGCSFASWGQQARVPSAFTSDVLHLTRYRDCQDGVVEYSHMVMSTGSSGVTLNAVTGPVGGVKTSTLPEFRLSGVDGLMKYKEEYIPDWQELVAINLEDMGGYMIFSQEKEFNASFALSYVHGFATDDALVRRTRLRYGIDPIFFTGQMSDFTNIAIQRFPVIEPGNAYFFVNYLINDKLSNIQEKARMWVKETQSGLIRGDTDFGRGRTIEAYSLDGRVFGVAATASFSDPVTFCHEQATRVCAGRSTPGKGLRAHFAITCGKSAYFGPNLYHFAPRRNDTGDPLTSEPILPYVCEGRLDNMRPIWKLVGFFPDDNSCERLRDAIYDPFMCKEQYVTQSPEELVEEKYSRGTT